MEMNDIHGTAEGSLPGVVITANSFLALMNNQHKVPIVMNFVLFVALFTISYQVISGKTIAKWLKAKILKWKFKIHPTILAYALSWVSYMSILSLVCIISYVCYGVIYDVFFTATLFQFFDYMKNHWSALKHPNLKMFKEFMIEKLFT